MNKISSKFLNIEGLAALIDASKNSSDFTGVLLLTSNAMIIGNISPVFSETDIPTAAELIYEYKESYINSLIDKKEQFEIIGDGSLLVVKNAILKSANSTPILLDEITLHCNDIIGFTPINLEEVKTQFYK